MEPETLKKGRCSVSAGATCLSVPPQGHVSKSEHPVWCLSARTDCRSTKASQSVTEAWLPLGPVRQWVWLPAAGCLAPPGQARAHCRLKSKCVCVREQTVLDKLGWGVGGARWWEGSSEKNPVKFSPACARFHRPFLAKDKKQPSCQMTAREKRRA